MTAGQHTTRTARRPKGGTPARKPHGGRGPVVRVKRSPLAADPSALASLAADPCPATLLAAVDGCDRVTALSLYAARRAGGWAAVAIRAAMLLRAHDLTVAVTPDPDAPTVARSTVHNNRKGPALADTMRAALAGTRNHNVK